MSETTAALQPTALIDVDHEGVVEFARAAVGDATDDKERARRLYLAVRDGFRYDPYRIDLSEKGLRASSVLEAGQGWCVTKSTLLAAACRAVGIPARLGLADVKNHLSTERLRESMGTDIFYCHGYTAIYLEGEWRKATPAFNASLCEKLGIHTLEFDGSADSIYHPLDKSGRQHMEYLAMRGEFDDVPRQLLLDVFAEHYSALPRLDKADWEADVQAEAKAAPKG